MKRTGNANVTEPESLSLSSPREQLLQRGPLVPSAAVGHAASAGSGAAAQNSRAPMLPTSLCSFTKISKYW